MTTTRGEVLEGRTRKGPSTLKIGKVLIAVCVAIAIVGLIIGLSVGLARLVAPSSLLTAMPTTTLVAERAHHENAPRIPWSADEWRGTQDHRKVIRMDSTDSTTQLYVGGWYSYMEPGTWVKAADSGNKRWCMLVKPPDGGTHWSLYQESAHLASFMMTEMGAGEVNNSNLRISIRGLLRPVNGVWAEATKLAMVQASGGKYHYYTLERLALFRDIWQMSMKGLSGLPWFLTTSGCPHVGGRVAVARPSSVLYTYDTTTNVVARVYESETGTSDWKSVLDDSAQDMRVYQVG